MKLRPALTVVWVAVLMFAASAQGDTTRNENSTPRDAVLPVSPALAAPENPSDTARAILWAKAILLRFGYDVGSLDERSTARFKASLFDFQKRHGLPASGKLDAVTLNSLEVRSR